MIGTKRKERMKKTFSIILLILLVNCSTTTTKKEEQKPSIDNIVDVFKSVPWPKF
jgi:PBP1b-binding outer membrane lipoprotein LpoB